MTKSQRSGSRPNLSKFFVGVVFLAAIKLAILFHWEMFPTDPFGGLQESTVLLASANAQEGQPSKATSAKPENIQPAVKIPAASGEDNKSESVSDQVKKQKEREQMLQRKEQELKEIEKEVDLKLARLSEIETRLKQMIEEADVLKDKKFRHLVDVYTNMKPKQAAEVLETLEESIAVKILAGLKGRSAGEILSFVSAQKAARLSAALSRVQIPGEEGQ